jgi:hypothetical protein
MACRSAVRGSGGDGLARRAIPAATTVVVPAVVATAMTAIVVLVVVPVATVVAVATAGRARRCGGWWPGCRGRSIVVERRWGSRRTCTIHVDLLAGRSEL